MNWCATFDLGQNSASWQFLQFLINAELSKPAGSKLTVEIRIAPYRIRPRGRDVIESHALFKKVMIPGIKLIGAERVQGEVPLNYPSQHYIVAVLAAREGKKIPRWTVPSESMEEVRHWLGGRKPLVITLRECRYWKGRNSNLEAWKQFAGTCGEDVIFVRDTKTADEPIDGFETSPRASRDLLFRAALMFQAKACLHVANGPMMIPLYSDIPWLSFKPLCPQEPAYGAGQERYWRRQKIDIGGQFPWSLPTQRMIWENDDYENIERAWGELSERLRNGVNLDRV
jgi:hypothetical protein